VTRRDVCDAQRGVLRAEMYVTRREVCYAQRCMLRAQCVLCAEMYVTRAVCVTRRDVCYARSVCYAQRCMLRAERCVTRCAEMEFIIEAVSMNGVCEFIRLGDARFRALNFMGFQKEILHAFRNVPNVAGRGWPGRWEKWLIMHPVVLSPDAGLDVTDVVISYFLKVRMNSGVDPANCLWRAVSDSETDPTAQETLEMIEATHLRAYYLK
jgi:hypothetical protein